MPQHNWDPRDELNTEYIPSDRSREFQVPVKSERADFLYIEPGLSPC